MLQIAKFKIGDRVLVGMNETPATIINVRVYSDIVECDVLFDGNPTTSYPYEQRYLVKL